MSAYHELLDATIQHLEGLKSRGVRHVAVAPETLRALSQPPPKTPISQFSIYDWQNVRSAGRQSGNLCFRAGEQVNRAGPVRNYQQPRSRIKRIPQSAIRNPDKIATFAALRERALACVKCPHLASSRKNVVFGVGNH